MLDDKLQLVPKLNVDYSAIQVHPTPEEYFLLSRITRKMAVSEICIISGQPREQTLKALSRLLEAGLLEAPDAPVAPDMSFGASTLSGKTPAVVAPAVVSSAAAPLPEAAEAADEEGLLWHALLPLPFAQFSPDDELMAEAPALSERVKRELQYVYAQLDQADYYQLLGLSRDADRKEVRAAFFAGSKRFHPDLFFGKELGGYKPMVDAIFQQLNKAQQILSNKNKREGYDAQLGEAQAPQAPQGAPSQVVVPVAPAPAPPRADSASSQERAWSSSGSGGLGEASSAELSVDERRKREAAFALLLRRGEKHELAGELELAAGEYRKAFAIKHDAAVALRGANLLLRLGADHREEAILLARAAAKENPREIKALLLVGDAYEELERLDEALLYYKRALEIEPDSEVIRRRIEYVQNMMR